MRVRDEKEVPKFIIRISLCRRKPLWEGIPKCDTRLSHFSGSLNEEFPLKVILQMRQLHYRVQKL